MFKISRLAALLIAGAVVSAPALAAEKGKAIATVNGQASHCIGVGQSRCIGHIS